MHTNTIPVYTILPAFLTQVTSIQGHETAVVFTIVGVTSAIFANIDSLVCSSDRDCLQAFGLFPFFAGGIANIANLWYLCNKAGDHKSVDVHNKMMTVTCVVAGISYVINTSEPLVYNQANNSKHFYASCAAGLIAVSAHYIMHVVPKAGYRMGQCEIARKINGLKSTGIGLIIRTSRAIDECLSCKFTFGRRRP